MRSLARLLAEARAHGMLRPLAADAVGLAVVFGFLSLLWIATP